MKIEDGMPQAVLNVAVGVLKKWIPDLTCTTLVDCIQKYDRPEAVTITKACEMLSVGRTKLWRLCKSGKIHTFYIGSSVRIPTDEIERVLACGMD